MADIHDLMKLTGQGRQAVNGRDTVSAETEQYRERLAWTAYRAFMDHIKIDGTKEYDELLPETKDAMHAETEAVAAQVLRDVINDLTEHIAHNGVEISVIYWGDLMLWMAQRGIGLTDGGDA